MSVLLVTNLLERKELQVITLVSRNTPGQEDGIDSSIFLDKFALVLMAESVGWAPP